MICCINKNRLLYVYEKRGSYHYLLYWDHQLGIYSRLLIGLVFDSWIILTRYKTIALQVHQQSHYRRIVQTQYIQANFDKL